jgi:hypothetical protein
MNKIEITKEDDQFYEKNPDWKPHYWKRKGEQVQVGWKKLDNSQYAFYKEYQNQVDNAPSQVMGLMILIVIIIIGVIYYFVK